MKLLRSKSGVDLPLKAIMGLIFVFVIVFLPTFSYVMVVNKNTAYERGFFNKEIGLIIESLQGYDDDLRIDYRKTNRFGFKLNPTSSEIYDNPFAMANPITKRAVYKFIHSKDNTIKPVELRPKTRWENRKDDEDPEAMVELRFCKTGNEISFQTQEEPCTFEQS